MLTDFIGEVDRNGKAQPAIQSIDQRVHADDLAINVAKRAARISRINRGVGLNVIGNGITAVADQFAAPLSAHHPVGEGVIESEWRPDGESKLPDPNGVAVAHLHYREIFGLDFDDSDVRLVIRSDDFRGKLAPVFQFNVYVLRTFNDVVISENISVRPDDESRTFANRVEKSWTTPGRIVVGLTWRKQVIKIKPFVAIVLFRDFDDDDTGCDDFENFGEGIIQGVNDILTGLRGGRRNGGG